MSPVEVSLRALRACLDDCTSALERCFTYVEADKSGGWHQFLHSKKTGAVATAQGFACLAELSSTHYLLNPALSLLEAKQFGTSGRSYGGYTINVVDRVPLTEATATVAWSLGRTIWKLDPQCRARVQTVVDKCWTWLQANRNPDGGWGPIVGMESAVYATGLALLSLSETASGPGFQPAITGGRKWLEKSRNKDGGWGQKAGDKKSTPFHTAIALAALSASGASNGSCFIRDGVSWLDANWKKDSMWEVSEHASNLSECYDIETGSGADYARAVWNHFPTPWVVYAYIRTGCWLGEMVPKSVNWLVATRQEAGWARPNVNEFTTWALHDSFWTVLSFLSALSRPDNYERAQFIGRSVSLNSMPRRKELLLVPARKIIHYARRIWGVLALVAFLAGGYSGVVWGFLSGRDFVLSLLIPLVLLVIQLSLEFKRSENRGHSTEH